MNLSLLFEVSIVVCSLSGHALCKECTNIPTELSSHTFRYELLTSNNKTWQDEVFSFYHLAHTDDAAWAHLFPRKMLKEEDKHSWTMMYRQMKDSGGVNQLKEVSLHDVRLDANSMHGQAQQTNFEYLMWLDVDRLVWSFRKTAGLDTPGQPYGGWEAPTLELRGHFVGHYLSATAQMWASTHNDTLKKKMTDVVSALSACQEKIGSGYLSAFPWDLFDRLEARTLVWAPYYTIHKIMAGLLNQYMFAGNDQALKMVKWMADYFNMRVQNVISKFTLTRHWQTLNDETGGMNDVLYKLYTITGDQKHLTLAHLFDKPCFLGLLAVKSDDLANFHSNTHIPVVVGAQMRYEITGDPLYKDISTFFMDIVNSSHSYATGGTSINEFWSDPKRLADTLQVENEESCTTYNMLKVSRHLFRWTKEAVYADYYERALTNGVLSIQRGRDPGVMIYMLPLGRGVSKAKSKNGWGKKNDTFWCCYGTGIESFSKLGDSIYFQEEGIVPSLYIIQYISSSLNWRSRNISLNQEVGQVTSFDPHLRVTFKFASNEQATSGGEAALNFRIPLWTTSDGAKASLNGQNLPLVNPGNFLSVNRSWTPGDNITFDLPITLRTEAIKDERPEYASLLAILYGPYLLAGLSEGDWDIAAKPAAPFSDWITPVPGDYNYYLVSLSQESNQSEYALTASNASLNMAPFPQPGTNEALASTFRLILDEPKQGNYSGPHDAVGKSVMLEPFNSPGTVITQFGQEKGLGFSPASPAAKFRMSPGLDGKKTSISLESEEKKGCYVYNADTSIMLRCQGGSADEGFKKGSSFTMKEGISEYHPISFVAKGVHKKFLLVPLLSLRDENYTVYFNFGAQ